MYRILNATKDTYIQNKVIAGERAVESNVGSAGTLDLFKLYDETAALSASADKIELSRILINFDLSPLTRLTSSFLDISGSNFKCFLNLKDVYGGQTTPHQFTVQVCPLAKSFDEGIGMDIVAFRDLDAANWITASNASGIIVPWAVSGAFASGAIGDSNIDYYISGAFTGVSTSLCSYQYFDVGHEDLMVDVTSIISASLFNNFTNNGFLISFTPTEEQDDTTRFVKRFGSRHTIDKSKHPKMIVKWDGEVLSDDLTFPLFNTTNKFFIYNTPRGIPANFSLNSVSITGSNCLTLELLSSRSLSYWTSSFSQTHSQSINHITTSLIYFSTSFSASQVSFGTKFQTGIYSSDVLLDLNANAQLEAYASGSSYEVKFVTKWKSPNGTLISPGQDIIFKKYSAFGSSFDNKNCVVNILNLKEVYPNSEYGKLRVFIQDYDFEVFALRMPRPSQSRIFKRMYWRLIDPYSKKEIIPFDEIGTKLSSDSEGMYFDFWFEDLEPNEVYEFEFKIVEDDNVTFITNQGFIFKVVS